MKDETAKTCMLDDAVIRGVARVVIKSGIHSRVIYDGKLGQVEVIAAKRSPAYVVPRCHKS
jgi:hypothetical protein